MLALFTLFMEVTQIQFNSRKNVFPLVEKYFPKWSLRNELVVWTYEKNGLPGPLRNRFPHPFFKDFKTRPFRTKEKYPQTFEPTLSIFKNLIGVSSSNCLYSSFARKQVTLTPLLFSSIANLQKKQRPHFFCRSSFSTIFRWKTKDRRFSNSWRASEHRTRT